MLHIEDRILYGGVTGTRQAIFALRDLRDMLAGHGGKINSKWDGSPAIFAGIDPYDGEFFVAKKGIFNKNPKVYKTPQDIDDDTSGDLNDKLKDALKYLPELGIKGVVQGDFLFSQSDLKTEMINGQKYVTFHPNTILYAVPYDQSKQIRRAKIGIVWHTRYTGNSFESMSASYGVDASKFKPSKNVWSVDSFLKVVPGATLTKRETKEINDQLSRIGKIFNQISGTTLRAMEKNPELARLIETFNNSFVRRGETIANPTAHVNKLIAWIKDKYGKEITDRKTSKGRNAQQKKLNEILSFFSTGNKASLVKMFEMQKEMVVAKKMLINKFDSLSNVDTFVKTKDGYRVTGQEGYVAVDKVGDAVKLVDRMEFSYNNFSKDIVKGWENSSRS